MHSVSVVAGRVGGEPGREGGGCGGRATWNEISFERDLAAVVMIATEPPACSLSTLGEIRDCSFSLLLY